MIYLRTATQKVPCEFCITAMQFYRTVKIHIIDVQLHRRWEETACPLKAFERVIIGHQSSIGLVDRFVYNVPKLNSVTISLCQLPDMATEKAVHYIAIIRHPSGMAMQSQAINKGMTFCHDAFLIAEIDNRVGRGAAINIRTARFEAWFTLLRLECFPIKRDCCCVE